jgi:hypothetical protein
MPCAERYSEVSAFHQSMVFRLQNAVIQAGASLVEKRYRSKEKGGIKSFAAKGAKQIEG